MAIAVVLMASSVWGLTSSDISSTAATTITDGGLYVIGTSSSANLLNGEWHNSNWGYCTNTVGDAVVFTAHGSTSSFYLTSSVCGTIVAATSNFPIYNNGTSENLSLGGSGQIQNKASSSYILRFNVTGARWYSSSTGSVMYLYPVTLPARTVTYNAGSGTCKTSDTESSGGSGITLAAATPSPACAAEGWVFAGWKQTSAQTETTLIPTMYAAGSKYYPTANETLYAVYRLGTVYTIDFESTLDSYSDWSFNQINSKQSTIHTHGDRYYGSTTGGAVTITTAAKIASPKDIRFYVSKESGNTTASTWKVQTSDDGSTWADRKSESAVGMYAPTWLEVSQDLSSYTNVYVRITYGTSTAVRTIDDVTLSCATYNSNPSCCDKIVELSKGTQTNATISSFSPSSVPTCSNTAADRNVTITVAAATGYEFTSSARLSYSGDGTATYQSGPTGSGPYTFVYQFAKNDNGDGTFSVTSATPQTYTITYMDQGGVDFSGTQAGAPTTHTYGTATTLKIPTKYGHTFGGWFTASDCASGAVGTSSSATLGATDYTANITLYAKWTEKSLTNYRTSCCTDPGLSFLDENEDPTTTYTIVREDLASASTAVEIDCDFGSLNTSSAFTWYSTSRAAKTFPETGATSRTTPSSQLSYMTIDMSNKTITASQTGIYTITIKQEGATISETVYCDAEATVTVTVKTVDKFIDAVNGNFSGEAQRLEDVGGGILLPTEATFSTNNACHSKTRRLLGWIKASDLNSYRTSGRVDYIDDLKTGDPATNKVIAPGTRVEATGVTWYAVWGEEVTP